VRNGALSDSKGREVFDDVAFIHILFPGDRTKERRTKATAEHKMRFRREWELFERQASQAPTGTPIEQWPMVSKGTALNLKSQNILTVEILAAVGDHVVDTITLGGRDLREKAKAWLASADGGAEVGRLVEDNKNLRADVEMLKAQIAELGANAAAKKGK
jgi:hypothetical protein